MEKDPSGRKELNPCRDLVTSERPLVFEPSIPEVIKEIVRLSKQEVPLLKAVFWRSDGREIWPVFESHDREQLFRFFNWECEWRERACPDSDIDCLIRSFFLLDKFPNEENLPVGINYLQWAPWSEK